MYFDVATLSVKSSKLIVDIKAIFRVVDVPHDVSAALITVSPPLNQCLKALEFSLFSSPDWTKEVMNRV